MNGKKAKRIRSEANRLTEGQPRVSYNVGRPPTYINLTPESAKPKFKKVGAGKPITLNTNCTRSVNKTLKMLYKSS